jgi:hypothetical protein
MVRGYGLPTFRQSCQEEILRIPRQIEIAYGVEQFRMEDFHYDPLLKLI